MGGARKRAKAFRTGPIVNISAMSCGVLGTTTLKEIYGNEHDSLCSCDEDCDQIREIMEQPAESFTTDISHPQIRLKETPTPIIMDFNATFGKPTSPQMRPQGQAGPRFLIIGNFMGTTKPPQTGLQLTMGHFEEQFQAACPRLKLNGESFQFQSIDDFHPDHLLKQSSRLQGLMEQAKSIRKEGKHSLYFKALISHRATHEEPTGERSDSNTGTVFSDLLGEPPQARPDASQTTEPSNQNPAVEKLIQSALQGSEQLSNNELDQVAFAQQQLDAQLSAGLSQILHHPEFQALEARWRQLDRLMASLEDDNGAEIHLLPLNKAQWQSWLDSPILAVETIQRQLELLGSTQALFLSHRFDTSEAALNLLQQLSSFADQIETPLITGGQPSLIGHDSLPEQFGSHEVKQIEDSPWSRLKPSLQLDHLYITIQGALTRLPYNPKDDPIDSFAYTEDATPLQPNELLRGDAALIIARLWLEHFLETASPIMPPTPRTLDDCPIYTIDRQLLPVAECWMSDEAANILQSHGMVPLRSPKNSGQISIYL